MIHSVLTPEVLIKQKIKIIDRFAAAKGTFKRLKCCHYLNQIYCQHCTHAFVQSCFMQQHLKRVNRQTVW